MFTAIGVEQTTKLDIHITTKWDLIENLSKQKKTKKDIFLNKNKYHVFLTVMKRNMKKWPAAKKKTKYSIVHLITWKFGVLKMTINASNAMTVISTGWK